MKVLGGATRWGGVALLAIVTALAGTGLARAASGSGSDAWLAWSSAPVCGDARAFAARVERALGRSPARAAADAHVNVTAHLVPAAVAGLPRWVGEVRLRGDDQRDLGSRTIDRRDASCQPLIDALAVVTALALADDGVVPSGPADAADQGSLEGASPPSEASVPTASMPTPSSASPPPPAATPERRESAPPPPPTEPVASLSLSPSPPLISATRNWRSGVDGGVKIGMGLLPRVAFGAEVSAYLRTAGGWRFYLAFDGWQRQTSLDGLGRGASYQRLGVGLGLCPLTMARGRWDGAACLGGDVGRLSISGVGFTTTSTEDRLTLDAGLGATINRRLVGPLALGLTLDVTAPLIRDRINYATTDGTVSSIFQQSVVAVVAGLRLSVAF